MGTRFFGIDDIETIDFGRLTAQLPRRPLWNPFSTQGQYIRAILESQQMLERHGINTRLRLAHFLGQGLVETGWLSAKVESTNYSYETLKKDWSHKFSSDQEIRAFARKPERIANRIYGGRADLGNGPESSGDGWRYRGRGFFQLTGRDNYRRYGEMAKIDLIRDPEILERDLKTSLQVAAAYFDKTGLGPYADRNEVSAVSRGVNRGDPRSPRPANHEAQRIEWTAKAIALVRDPASLVLGVGGGPVATDDSLRIGSTGDLVKVVQRALLSLGYPAGADDGIFGPATRRAVLTFQDEHGLPATGVVDRATKAALEAAPHGAAAAAPQQEAPPVEVPKSEPSPAPAEAAEPSPPSDAPLPAPALEQEVVLAPEAPTPIEAPAEVIAAPAPEVAPPADAPAPTEPPIAETAPEPAQETAGEAITAPSEPEPDSGATIDPDLASAEPPQPDAESPKSPAP